MAEMSIEYPNISEQSPEGQLQQVKDYLFLLADKLNLQDNSAEKIFQEVSKAIDADAVATQDNEQSAKLREYANLKALIVKTGEYAMTHSEEISKVFNSSFGANSDFGKYYEELERRVTENAQGVEDLFTYTAGINNENGNFGVGTKQFIKSGLLYYDESQIPVFGVGVGVISTVATDEDKVIDLKQNRLATFAADEIAFWDNGNKVAYISGNAINFPAANIRGGSIHIGEEEHNFFKVDTAGNLKVGDYFSVDSSGIAKFKDRNEKMSLDLSSGDMVFRLNGEVEMWQSAEGISFVKPTKTGDLTLLKNIGGINVYLNPLLEDSVFYPTAKLSVFEVFDPNSTKVLGKLWDNGGTRSQLDIGGVYLRKDNDMNTEYGSLAFHNDSARLVLQKHDSKPWLDAYVNESGYSVLELHDSNGFGVNLGVAGGSGQFAVLNNGSIKGGMIASSSGAELRIGGGDSSWNMAWNKGQGSHLQADHHHFLGKSEGLFTGSVGVNDCSAYVVIGQPTSGGYYSSVTIPSEIATGRTWQIADEVNYVTFRISEDGSVAQTGGSSDSGSIKYAYSIR